MQSYDYRRREYLFGWEKDHNIKKITHHFFNNYLFTCDFATDMAELKLQH